jgi:hypothetical protein
VSAQKICTFDVGKDGQKDALKASADHYCVKREIFKYQILEFGTQSSQLYQFSSPTFISDEKILFSARKLIAPEIPKAMEYDSKKNTALFMSNFDGTNLERVCAIFVPFFHEIIIRYEYWSGA